MKKRSDIAAETFNNGFNCAQAVLSAFCDELSMDKTEALKISCGFGGGMGRLQETCGAVTGAYMVISLKYGKYSEEDDAAREKTYALVREFSKRFEEKHKTTSCRELLDVDFINGDKQVNMARVKEVCHELVRSAVEIVEELI